MCRRGVVVTGGVKMAKHSTRVERAARKLHAMGATVSVADNGVPTIHIPAGGVRAGRVGDNSDMNAVTAAHLKAFIKRIERLEEEKRAIASDIRNIYYEAKGNGFDASILRKIVAMRRIEPSERAEKAELLVVYLRALGME